MANNEFGYIIDKLRKEKGYTQVQLADLLDVSKSSVSMWELKERLPSPEVYERIADLFNVDIDFLYGRTSIRKKVHFDEDGTEYHVKGVSIPILGRVAAGIPIEAITDIIDYEEITQELASTGDFFGLRIKGDSMEPRIHDGDNVIVRKQSDVDSGEVAIVMVNGQDATCKKVIKEKNGILLQPLNPNHTPRFYTEEDIEKIPVTILGRVMEARSKF